MHKKKNLMENVHALDLHVETQNWSNATAIPN